MRKLIAILLLALPLLAETTRELSLARQMLEDAAIRNDEEGLRLMRERLLRLIAETDDRTILRDAHYLVALGAQFERFSGRRDAGATAELVATGIRHADRALELDASSPGVALFHGMMRSFNPAGPAFPEGVQILEKLVARLDADRVKTGRRFGLWDANAHAWLLFVRMASRSEAGRAPAAGGTAARTSA